MSTLCGRGCNRLVEVGSEAQGALRVMVCVVASFPRGRARYLYLALWTPRASRASCSACSARTPRPTASIVVAAVVVRNRPGCRRHRRRGGHRRRPEDAAPAVGERCRRCIGRCRGQPPSSSRLLRLCSRSRSRRAWVPVAVELAWIRRCIKHGDVTRLNFGESDFRCRARLFSWALSDRIPAPNLLIAGGWTRESCAPSATATRVRSIQPLADRFSACSG